MMRKTPKGRGGKPVKVYFDLVQDKTGYPPTKTEFLWCAPTKRGTYVVDNIPFFARDISLGDEISAEKVGQVLHFSGLVRKSNNSTVRVLLKQIDKAAYVREKLEALGCGTEFMDELGLLAVSMPANSKIAESLSFLDEETEKDSVGIEESAVRYK
jgi:hypothetical protein